MTSRWERAPATDWAVAHQEQAHSQDWLLRIAAVAAAIAFCGYENMVLARVHVVRRRQICLDLMVMVMARQ